MSSSIITGSLDPAAAGVASRSTPVKKSMDSEVFMQLLVAQLKNQDPSNPMDTNAMIGQTTQLAMMESLTKLAELGQESFGLQMRAAAAAYIGREVGYVDAQGVAKTGTASSVSFSSATPTVTVDGVDVPLDAVTGITA